jgi:hypothetical protein
VTHIDSKSKKRGAFSASKQIDLFWPEKIIGHHAPKENYIAATF